MKMKTEKSRGWVGLGVGIVVLAAISLVAFSVADTSLYAKAAPINGGGGGGGGVAFGHSPIPLGTITLGGSYYNQGQNKYNYQLFYNTQNVFAGSIKIGNTVIANNINSSGSVWTGYILQPRTTYIANLYSGPNGTGFLIGAKGFNTSNAPSYGYQN